ncbi:MAG: cobalamin biosynthesis protein [Nitrospirota bacterium]
MTFTPWHIWAAFLLDLIVGDPHRVPQPILIIEKSARSLERFFREKRLDLFGERVTGALFSFCIVFITFQVSSGFVLLGGRLHSKIQLALLLYLAYTTLMTRSLGDTAYGVYNCLLRNDLPAAQITLSSIISSDTTLLSEEGVILSTVYTVARKSAQGIVAPLLYLSLGGVPVAMAYQAIVTLHAISVREGSDASEWNWVLRRLSLFANFIPDCITGFLMAFSAAFLFGRGKETLMMFLGRGRKWEDPVASIPEAAAAGAIGTPLALSGRIENEIRNAQSHHIQDVIKLMGVTACLMLVVCMMIQWRNI